MGQTNKAQSSDPSNTALIDPTTVRRLRVADLERFLREGRREILSMGSIQTVCACECWGLLPFLLANTAFSQLQLACNLNLAGAQAIATALRQNSTLVELDLEGTNIGSDGIRHIADALKSNTALTHLSLGGNSIEDSGAEEIAMALNVNKTIAHLDLESNSIGASGARAIAEAVKRSTTLQELLLEANKIGPVGASHIAVAMKHSSTLKRIHMGWNGIGSSVMMTITDALLHNEALTALDVGGSSLGSEGAQHISYLIRHSSTLRELGLAANDIKEGAQHVARALLDNTSITKLNLGWNCIDDCGALHIAAALEGNLVLQHLILEENLIGDHGAQMIEAALKTNHRSALTDLDLEENPMSSTWKLRISAALSSTVPADVLHERPRVVDGGAPSRSTSCRCCELAHAMYDKRAPKPPLLQQHEILVDQSTILGGGAHADVFGCSIRNDSPCGVHKSLAAKVFHRNVSTDAFLREVKKILALEDTCEYIMNALAYSVGEPNVLLMPRADGTLTEAVRRATSTRQVLELLRGVVRGLMFLHSHTETKPAMVHLDIKPSNVLMVRGVPKIADFGTAHALKNAAGAADISTKSVVGTQGTARYMDLMHMDDAAGWEPTPQHDVYSLGVMLWEIIGEKDAWAHLKSVSETGILRRMLKGESLQQPLPNALQKWCPPNALLVVVARAVSLDVERRPSLQEFMDALNV